MELRTKRILSGILGLAGLTGTAWLGTLAAVVANQHNLIFKPAREREVARPRSGAHRTRQVVLYGTDGTRLGGWLMTPQGPGPHPAVIYFGGRSEEVSWVARDAAAMFPGMAVLAMNYRGYGDSHGHPGERQMIADGEMLFDWLIAHRRVDPARVVVVGRSLGSGVAMQVAARRPVAAVTLITPYDSVLSMARRRFPGMPVGFFLKHRFESDKAAEKVRAPTLVLRAETDDVVPSLHTDSLVARLGGLAVDQTIPASDHRTIPYLAETQTRIAQFLCEHFFPAAAAVPRDAPTVAMPIAAVAATV